ncbi:MAG: iron-sulfur cluster assembly scaffold protein [Dehalococcoidia bacterium]
MAQDDKSEEEEARGNLRGLYSETVIDHFLNPRNLGRMDNYDGYAYVKSSCGDSMWLWLKVRYNSGSNDNVLQDVKFLCDVCVGAVSAGSMLTELIKGKTIREALTIGQDDILRNLGGLPDEFIHCAGLAEDTFKAAIKDYAVYKDAPWKRMYEQKR